jgi:hypothetical protein
MRPPLLESYPDTPSKTYADLDFEPSRTSIRRPQIRPEAATTGSMPSR